MSDRAPPTVMPAAAIDDMVNLARQTPFGNFAEIGVYKGGSAWHLARLAREQGRMLHLFDTFEGIPDKGPYDDVHKVGDFSDTRLADVRSAIPDANYHVGVFPFTLPIAWDEPLAFVHVDCDQYSGVKAAIDKLFSVLVDGGIMLFDDYECTNGCTKAVNESFLSGVVRCTSQGKAYVIRGDFDE
jgi:O-methyltransferase